MSVEFNLTLCRALAVGFLVAVVCLWGKASITPYRFPLVHPIGSPLVPTIPHNATRYAHVRVTRSQDVNFCR